MDRNVQYQMWQAEQEILDAIDKVCTENHLRYSLAYGTLLGAIRHRGFIPWDDDVDVMMPREDYEKLREIWKDKAPSGFLFQDEVMFDDYVNNFAKIRKDHTTFLQFELERSRTYHKGLYVDIFPGDRLAPKGIRRRLQYAACAVNLLCVRGYSSGTGGLTGAAERLLLLAPKKLRRRWMLRTRRYISKWNTDRTASYMFPCTIRSCKKYYPCDLFENMVRAEFQGKQYSIPRDYDAVLSLAYGDYMQLPPEEERVWKHHPILIDFEHNYEEIGEST